MGHLSSYVQKRSQFIFQLIVNKSINEVKNEWFLIKPNVSDVTKFFLLPKTEAYPTQ